MRVVVSDREYNIKELGLDKYDFLMKIEEMKDPQVIAFLTDAPIEEVKKYPFNNVSFISGMIKNHYYDLYSNTPLELTYTHKGVNYGLIIPSKITFAEWINLEVYMATEPINLPLIAAHLYKPLVGTKQGDDRELMEYSVKECEERSKGDFTDFPIRIFNSALFFFTTFVMEYTKLTLSFMETQQTGKKARKPRERKVKPNNPQ